MNKFFRPYWFEWFLSYQEQHVGLSELEENHTETNIIGCALQKSISFYRTSKILLKFDNDEIGSVRLFVSFEDR